jgi:hypothetical protein
LVRYDFLGLKSIKGELNMKLGSNPLSRKDQIVIQELRDEILIYDLQKNKALCLNQTSALIWQECDGTKSVAEISQSLSKKLKLNISQDIVWLALSQFKTDNLLTDSHQFITPFEGLTRREVVRRIGFASIIALPVISSVVAPTAIHAQSGAGGQCFPADNTGNDSAPGCPCQGTFDCCGICSATGTCANPPRPASIAQNDPGAAPVCFGNLACSPANGSGNDSVPGCPCLGTFDCCGICGAGGQCVNPTRPANPAQNDPGGAISCP